MDVAYLNGGLVHVGVCVVVKIVFKRRSRRLNGGDVFGEQLGIGILVEIPDNKAVGGWEVVDHGTNLIELGCSNTGT